MDLNAMIAQFTGAADPPPPAVITPTPVATPRPASNSAGGNLYEANRQWSSRPDDERFWTVEEMAARCRHYADSAREVSTTFNRLEIVEHGDNLALTGPLMSDPAVFTHWSFGKLCTLAGAPAEYLRSIDADLAAQCLNRGLARREQSGSTTNVLIHKNGHSVVRAFCGDGYSRIWNADIVERLASLQERGWRVPPARPAHHSDPRSRPATDADCLDVRMSGLGIKPGDFIAPAGLYASDHDCFAFMVNEDNRIDDGSDGGLSRGFFVSNSEVGAAAFKVTTFLYRSVCGNHIVWGASDVSEVRIIHRGEANTRWIGDLGRSLVAYQSQSQDVERSMVLSAMRTLVADNSVDAVETLRSKFALPIARGQQVIELAKMESDECRNQFAPHSVWGVVQGLTRLSQRTNYADQRVAADRIAGQILLLAQ